MKSFLHHLFKKHLAFFPAHSRIVALSAPFLFSALLPGCGQKIKYSQPDLGFRSLGQIEVDGYWFKDLNKNEALDPYEDWRLSPEERSRDLLSQMSLEQKAGFMSINTLNMLGSRKAAASGGAYRASDLDEGQVEASEEEKARTPNFIGSMNAYTSTRQRVQNFHNRHFILRLNEPAGVIATWNNNLQALCEAEPLGIPAIITSNPRNHISGNASEGTALDATFFTAWPGELGLSATRDLALIKEFAAISRQEWRAAGIRKGYMYMADLATEPRWSRVHGTFGEDPEWVAEIIREVVIGFQGEHLNTESIALTMKHFPGGGSGKDGQDSHFEWGKEQVFPGGRFYENLLPFRAAIDAGTSAIMPYYSMPVGTEFEEVGYSYNKAVIRDLLRGELGFSGIVNTDTGPLTRMVWGVEDLSLHERYAKALEAGSNIISGISDPVDLIAVVENGMVDATLIDESVSRLLIEKFKLGLFENPYVDPVKADKIVGNEQFRSKAAEALRKSIVLLRNEETSLPVDTRKKIYFETIEGSTQGNPKGEKFVWKELPGHPEMELVQTLEEADLAVQWILPSLSLFNATGEPISLSLSENNIDVAHVRRTASRIPTVLVVDYSNPWVIDEIYDDANKGNVVAVLATFGTTPQALFEVISGAVAPAGKMPFSTPVSNQAVTDNLEDVPGYLEGAAYALFHYQEGLSC